MRTRLARRPLVAGFLLAVALSGVAGCRTDPNVAAYVGDSRITDAELEAAVDQRLEDPAIADSTAGKEDAYTRQVLGLLVQEELYAEVAQRYELRIDDDQVRARIEQLLGGQDPDLVYQQLAGQGISRADVFENVRQQLVRQEVAEAEGLADGLSEAALRSTYEKDKQKYAQTQLGYINVPDQATADGVVDQLNAEPGRYQELAARYPGTYTLATVEARARDEVPPPLADAVAAAEPDSAFALAVQGVPGVLVGFVGRTVYRPFEQVRGDLEKDAAASADQAAAKLVDEVRADLDVTVNPRYGVLKNGTIEPDGGGVVDILGDRSAESGGAPAN